jgi:hypothetical protein
MCTAIYNFFLCLYSPGLPLSTPYHKQWTKGVRDWTSPSVYDAKVDCIMLRFDFHIRFLSFLLTILSFLYFFVGTKCRDSIAASHFFEFLKSRRHVPDASLFVTSRLWVKSSTEPICPITDDLITVT